MAHTPRWYRQLAVDFGPSAVASHRRLERASMPGAELPGHGFAGARKPGRRDCGSGEAGAAREGRGFGAWATLTAGHRSKRGMVSSVAAGLGAGGCESGSGSVPEEQIVSVEEDYQVWARMPARVDAKAGNAGGRKKAQP